MTPEIIVVQEEQIQIVSEHGIHFINDEGDEDFIAFMQCYEGFSHFVISDHAQEQLGLHQHASYEAFLERYRQVPAIAVTVDDDEPHHRFIGVVVLNISVTYTIYNFEFTSDLIYQDMLDIIRLLGWYVFSTSEIDHFYSVV